MRVVRTVAALREAIAEAGDGGVGLVPTMGALHEGHLSLVRAARQDHELVIVSVFVNPTQFNDAADLDAYPRDEARDVELAASAGADLVFAPNVAEMYPQGFATTVHVTGSITHRLEGAMRGSAHFDGVATVVAKLLIAVSPDSAYFGAKDAQQVVVVRRMVADLGIPTRIVSCPTSREEGGLARSSRNARLSPSARTRALAIPRALREIEGALSHGEMDAGVLKERGLAVLRADELEVEYLEIVDPDGLEALASVTRPALCVVAVRVENVRLIDNVLLTPAHALAAER
ncbi:pantoate--beta-alanine ligase [Leucobacter sp. W1478]|uniref:pantoate--beta-alanine ligase n=1 Tax=Leucobacter sp. W1478 TaxID=3439065 RepID=UPI003F3EAD76